MKFKIETMDSRNIFGRLKTFTTRKKELESYNLKFSGSKTFTKRFIGAKSAWLKFSWKFMTWFFFSFLKYRRYIVKTKIFWTGIRNAGLNVFYRTRRYLLHWFQVIWNGPYAFTYLTHHVQSDASYSPLSGEKNHPSKSWKLNQEMRALTYW